MKKRLILIAAGAVMLMGCSGNDYGTYQDCSKVDHKKMDSTYKQCAAEGDKFSSGKRLERHLKKCMVYTISQHCDTKVYRLNDSVPESEEPESNQETEW